MRFIKTIFLLVFLASCGTKEKVPVLEQERDMRPARIIHVESNFWQRYTMVKELNGYEVRAYEGIWGIQGDTVSCDWNQGIGQE